MSCALAACSSPDCPVCTVNVRFPRLFACGKDLPDGKTCGQVVGHPRDCRPGRAGKVEAADLRESEPVVEITNEQAAIQLAYKKRKREGAVRQQR